MVPDKMPEGERDTRMIGIQHRHQTGQPCTDRCKPYYFGVKIRTTHAHHYINGPFELKDEFKAMKGARWMGYDKDNPEKVWRVDNCRRNNFAMAYLEGLNPYAKYKSPMKEEGFQLRKTRKDWYGKEINIYQHQIEMTFHMLSRKQCIIAGEMGVGKTLSVFEAIELSLVPETWYVAPKSALNSVKLEAQKWRLRSKVHYMTYEELKKTLQNWEPGRPPPRFVVFDESSRVKTPTSQRSQAAFYLAENMRNAYGDDCYIILMSGSPAPKSPLDWYYQCEIACPGFIREGEIYKFQDRLAIMTEKEDIVGTRFRKLLGWKDGNTNRCNLCAGRPDEEVHTNSNEIGYHPFRPTENEVEKLYKRLAGLALVKLKKDCLDLPEKIYKLIKLKPTVDLMRAARIVTSTAKSAMETMTLLRELSDGFQYKDTVSGTKACTACNGQKFRYLDNGETEPCNLCGATGTTTSYTREFIEVPSPKMDAMTEIFDEYEEDGRLVVYAGFTASIDRLCNLAKKLGWEFIRVDGRGYFNSINPNWDAIQTLKEFQDRESKYDRIVFIGHPGSAGMGLTLTASNTIVYYSNDFNAESRIQSEDRIHRAGMDTNRGATIIDLCLLPTDAKILENLKRKRELQSITIGELQSAIDNYQYTSDFTP
jgi:SNF2 family DNA or RNA helicase